jgi:thiol:disulfide interchange protein DsbA
MNRRDFALGLGATPLMLGAAWAASDPVDGKDYSRLSTPIPVAVPGKVEVIEFFGYWCPHCNELEPKLEAWVKKLPADVNFRRVPVAWQEAQVPLQKLYYALEALGISANIQTKVFQAVHMQHLRLDGDAGLASFASANGIDKAKLADAMKSFGVAAKIRAANQLFAAYRIDGVPTLAIHGRFVTSPEQTGGEDRALLVADALIRSARR